MDSGKVRRAVDILKETVIQISSRAGFQEDEVQLGTVDDLNELVNFVEMNFDKSLASRMWERWVDLVVVFDDGAINIIYRYLVFWMIFIPFCALVVLFRVIG